MTEWILGGVGILGGILGLVFTARFWGAADRERDLAKKEAEDATRRLSNRMGIATPDRLARSRAARRRLRELADED